MIHIKASVLTGELYLSCRTIIARSRNMGSWVSFKTVWSIINLTPKNCAWNQRKWLDILLQTLGHLVLHMWYCVGYVLSRALLNPRRRACAARVTVVVVSVCLSASYLEQSIAPQTMPRIQRRSMVEINVGKQLHSGVMAWKPSERANMPISTGLPRDARSLAPRCVCSA